MRRGRIVTLVLGALALSAFALADRPAGERYDGEYGLWVSWRGDSIAVRWMTRAVAAGFLEVSADGHPRFASDSPPDSVHTLVFEDPKVGALTLHYGGRGSDGGTHTTVIRDPASDGQTRVTWPAADSIIVVSDIHGEFDRLIRVLQNAGVVGPDLKWTGGRKHLVIAGDVFDRGPDAIRAIWFLYGLEPQAERAGGRLHMVLGNHEIMVMTGDLRYLSAKDSAIARRYGTTFDAMFDPHNSVIGRWLAHKPALIRIGDILFAHGGVSTDYMGWTLSAYQDSLAVFTNEELFTRWADTTFVTTVDSVGLARRNEFFWGERSVFWYRDYVLSDSTAADLAAVLKRFGATLAVVGHTPMTTGITQRFGGRLIDVNTFPFVSQALLLARTRSGVQRFRIGENGPPERIE